MRPKLIVGVGGSSGALKAYKALLEALPSDTGMAVVIVSHMNPEASTALAEILSRHSAMKVSVAANAMPIQANRVYVIPSKADVLVGDYTFQIVSPRATGYSSVDVFLNSLAQAMGRHGAAVILSGYGRDGSDGCRRVREMGGTTFAQDHTAEVGDMPLSAAAMGVDFVLSAEKIAEELAHLAARSTVPDQFPI